MLKRIFLFFGIMILTLSVSAGVALAQDPESTDQEGSIVKIEGGDTLYYIASDGKRYVYPSEKTYKTWFDDFSDVRTISQEELASYQLAGNIRYRPGVVLVKIQSDPKVYAVSKGGVLRWVKTEKLAKKLYGTSWANLVDDISASFFINYTIGENIDDNEDYNPDEEIVSTDTVEANRGLAVRHLAKRAKTTRCKIAKEIHDRLEGNDRQRGANAIRAIATRVCRADHPRYNDNDVDNDNDRGDSNDSNDDNSTVVNCNQEPMNIDCICDEGNTKQQVQCNDDACATVVSYECVEIENDDDNDNSDTTAPIISFVTATPNETSAIITWTTDEVSTSKVMYSTESLETSNSNDSMSSLNLVTEHSIELTGLTAGTTYFFKVSSTDEEGNISEGIEEIFDTTTIEIE